MKIKQKLQDYIALVKKDRKTQIISGGVAAAIIALFVTAPGGGAVNPEGRAPKVAPKKEKSFSAIGSRDIYKDLLETFKAQLDNIQTKTEDNSKQIAETQQQLKQSEERSAEIFKRIIDRLGETAKPINSNEPGSAAPVDVAAASTAPADAPAANPEELDQFGNPAETNVAPPPQPEMAKVAFIGAGDSVRVKLLAGVNAATDGTPYPVIFKIVGDIHGPDGSALPIGEARLIAAAQGSLSDQRALFRLTTLNLRLPDGRRKVLDVDGWVVGEDGIRGMEGVLIDPIGKAIAGSMMVGALSGLGQGLSQTQTQVQVSDSGAINTQVTGDIGAFMAGNAASSAANQWSSIVADRVSRLVPHVQVYSGREATAVFAKSIAIRDLYEALSSEDSVYTSLD